MRKKKFWILDDISAARVNKPMGVTSGIFVVWDNKFSYWMRFPVGPSRALTFIKKDIDIDK